MSVINSVPTVEFLHAYGDAWNRHDLDAIMSMMTSDCIFEAASGPQPWGERYEGQEAVRQAIHRIFENVPDAGWKETSALISGDRGVTEWRFTGTTRDGSKIDTNGVDVFTFRDGKIHVKNALRKASTR